MKIYTKSGDRGETGLYGGTRRAKDDPRIEACGSVDELNPALGVVRAAELPPEMDRLLEEIQNRLFDLGAQLATPQESGKQTPEIDVAPIARLEQAIDAAEAALPPLREFILPGGTPQAAGMHMARTICRRAERRVVALARREQVAPTAIVYLNRLSDLLFVLGRRANAAAGLPDIPWRKTPPEGT